MNYTLEDVCKRMLDNANLTFNLSEYPKIQFDFTVFGQVDDKLWEIIFTCEECISLELTNDNDSNLARGDIFINLEANAKQRISTKDEKFKINNRKEKMLWDIFLYATDVTVEITCCQFEWQLNEFSHEEYMAKAPDA